MPTFCDLAGVKNYVKKYTNKKKDVDYFDGISFAPTLLGQEGQKKHDFLYWEFDETDQIGVRMGDWKMVVKKGLLSFTILLQIFMKTMILLPDIRIL